MTGAVPGEEGDSKQKDLDEVNYNHKKSMASRNSVTTNRVGRLFYIGN